jgi:hypothetical protein
MNTVPLIVPGSITGMAGLTDRPVFFLKLNNSLTPNLVVKGEATGNTAQSTDDEKSISVKWGSKLMKNVNNALVNTKIMTLPEITVFLQAAQQNFAAGTKQAQFASAGPTGFKWVKMPYVAGLSDADAWSKKDGKYVVLAPDAKKVIERFAEDRVWSELGKILAVDIFNGNSDRFDVEHGHWVNNGNVMFLDGGTTKVIGLDTFQPGGDHSNLARAGHFDALKNMTDPMRRKAFSEAVATSVGEELEKLMKKASMGSVTIVIPGAAAGMPDQIRRIGLDEVSTVFLPFAPLLDAGIAAGANDLKNYLQKKVRQYRTAGGIAPPGHGAAAAAALPPPAMPALPPPPVVPRGPIMGANRRAPVVLPPPPPPRTPVIGQNRVAPTPPPRPAMPAPPAPPVLAKTIPQGILDRMAFLGWTV